jgi:hypothetical protein
MGSPRTTHRDSRKFRGILNTAFEKVKAPIQDKIERFVYEHSWIDVEHPTQAMLLRLRKELVGIIKSGMLERQNREEDIIVCAHTILVLRLEYDRQHPPVEDEG